MRRQIRSTIVSAAAIALAACSRGQVIVERDPGAPIPLNATYAWAGQDASTNVTGQTDAVVNNDMVHRRVQDAVDTVLARHGWRATTPDSADFMVRYNIGRRMERSTYTTMNYGYGAVPVLRCGFRTCWSNWGWGAYGMPIATTQAYTYPEGTLLVDLVDRAKNRLVFRGIGTEPLEMKDLDPSRLQREVARILQSLPGHAAD